MKNKEVISGIVGASFFAIGYIGLSIAVLPSLAVGAGAYVASELLMSGKKKIEEELDNNLPNRIAKARKQNRHLSDMVKELNDDDIKYYLKEICSSANKIINAIEKNKLNNRSSNRFLDYYLPVCVNIIDRYDEIENQELTSKDSKNFMKNSHERIKETSIAFKKILDNLYQTDIEDSEAELKVYNQMLKADGYNSEELNVKDGDLDE